VPTIDPYSTCARTSGAATVKRKISRTTMEVLRKELFAIMGMPHVYALILKSNSFAVKGVVRGGLLR
jgi:hypothetical protein